MFDKVVIPCGNVLVSKMSRRWDVLVVDFMEARELYEVSFAFEVGTDCVIVLEMSFSTV